MPAMLANREDIDANMDDQLPVLKPSDQPYCYASDFKVPGPQRRYAIGVRSHLEGFGGAAGSWIAGRGDLKAGISTSGKLHQCEVCVQLEGRRVRLTHKDYGETCTAGGSGNNIHRFRIFVCPTVFVCPHCCCFKRSATGNMACKRNVDLCNFDIEKSLV